MRTIFVVPPEHRKTEAIRRQLRRTFDGPIRKRPTAFRVMANKPGTSDSFEYEEGWR